MASTPAEMIAAKAAKRAADLARQAAERLTVDGYTIQPAIGSTGGAANVGWELIAPPGCGPDWFLRTREEAAAALFRHKCLYDRRGGIPDDRYGSGCAATLAGATLAGGADARGDGR